MNIGRVASSGPVPVDARQKAAAGRQQVEQQKQRLKLTAPDLDETKSILNEITNNTRFSYSINEKIDSFVVKIIDRNTDKVVKEIPSRELQTLHENLREAIGIFIDRMV
ncbi:MAG: flagellar protein FlaG [Spirochaetales bacterium]|nr:flagellar protein FlaG [Spirochaetales bacterium]